MMESFLSVSFVFRRVIFFSLLGATVSFLGLITLKNATANPLEVVKVEKLKTTPKDSDKIYSIEGNVMDLPALSYSLILPNLTHELRVVKESIRPDQKLLSEKYLLILNSKDKKKLSIGEKAYLTYKNDSYVFSPQPTALSLAVTELSGDCIDIEVAVKPEEIAGASIRSQTKIFKLPLQQEAYADMAHLQQDEAFSWLSGAQWWSPDLVLHFLGNKEQKILGKKQRLKISCLDLSYLCILDENDWLYWKDGKWIVTSNIIDAKGCPLAHIKSLGQKELEIEGWDAKGEEKYVFLLLHQPIEAQTTRVEDIIKSLRLKTKSQVTCQLDKQMLSLRIGDAFYRADKDKWKVVKNFRCLSKQMKEIEGKPFFVFEKIQIKEGQKFFIGCLFNDSHTQMKPIELSIQRAGVKGPSYLEKNHIQHGKPSLSGR